MLTVLSDLVLQEEEVHIVEVGTIVCFTEEEGKAAMKLLAVFPSWQVKHLCL